MFLQLVHRDRDLNWKQKYIIGSRQARRMFFCPVAEGGLFSALHSFRSVAKVVHLGTIQVTCTCNDASAADKTNPWTVACSLNMQRPTDAIYIFNSANVLQNMHVSSPS